MNIATFEAGGQTNATVLHEMDLNRRVPAPVLGQKIRQRVLDDLWRGTDPKYSGLARFEQARAFTERVGFRQQVTAAPEQVFTLRRELDAATDAVEQWHAQFGFQRMNLPGKRRLAQIHAIGTAGETAGVGNADKGAQVTKVHAGHDNNFASIEKQ
jgi:hypothetical protein